MITQDPTIPCSLQIYENVKTMPLQEVLKELGEILNIEKAIDGERYFATIFNCKAKHVVYYEDIWAYADTPREVAERICEALTDRLVYKKLGWFKRKYVDLRRVKVVLA